MLTSLFFSERAVEVKIYSRTDTFLEPRLQRAKRGNNSARSLLGWFLIPKTIVVRGNRNHVRKCIVRITIFRLLAPKGKDNSPYPSLALHTNQYHAGTCSYKIWLATK